MSQSVMLDAISSQNRGLPKIELAEILTKLIQIADDHRGQTGRIEMAGSHLGDLIRCNGFDTRYELRVVVVRKVEQRNLRDCSGNLVERLEVPRVASRQRRNADGQLFG